MRSAANTKLPFRTETTSVSAGSLAASSPAMTSTRAAISAGERRIGTVGRLGMADSLFDDGHDLGGAGGWIVERLAEAQSGARPDRAFDQWVGTFAQHVVVLPEDQSQSVGR